MKQEEGLYYFIKYLLLKGKFKKEKLFLCSKEIKENEEFYFDDNPIYNSPNKQVMSGFTLKMIGENPALLKFIYKIIGEISPDALSYVKEGMEFSEDDIEKGGGYFLYYYEGMRTWTKQDDDPDFRFLKIRGPCGHFH